MMLTRTVALWITAIFAISSVVPSNTFACNVVSSGLVETRRTRNCGPPADWGHYTRYNKYQITWSDYSGNRYEISGSGECFELSEINCEPYFGQPYYGSTSTTASFYVNIDHKKVASGGLACELDFNQTKTINHNCSSTVGGCNSPTWADGTCSTGFVAVDGTCTRSEAFQNQCIQNNGDYDLDSCSCTGSCGPYCSPIVVDVLGNGFSLTNASNGVNFDLNNDSVSESVSWTSDVSDDAWLALDRNNNGSIDSGVELFGDISPQDPPPSGQQRNGFRALALYDEPARGGNGDGKINSQDSIFERLKLWQDTNKNGVSESCEMFGLTSLGLVEIDLDYKFSSQTDQYGNAFRYRSKVTRFEGPSQGRWAWDVFLVTQP